MLSPGTEMTAEDVLMNEADTRLRDGMVGTNQSAEGQEVGQETDPQEIAHEARQVGFVADRETGREAPTGEGPDLEAGP